MAKSQKKSKREIRKPKADKSKSKVVGIGPKEGIVPGLENMKR